MTVHQSEKFGHIDLGSTLGIQTALSLLGFDPGDLDGLDGPKTQTAVRAFQAARSLAVDGLVGPNTCAAIDAALHEAVVASLADSTGMEG